MPEVVSNTSPLLYLHRIGVLDWLTELFGEIRVPGAVVHELNEGRLRGYSVPDLEECSWVRIVDPQSVPPEWFALDLGPGELAAVSLALENRWCLLFFLLEEAHIAQGEPGFDLFRHLFGKLLVFADFLRLSLSLVVNKDPPNSRVRRFLSDFYSHGKSLAFSLLIIPRAAGQGPRFWVVSLS